MLKYSLRQIKDSYAQKKEWEKQFPTTYFLLRPPSFYLTYVVMKITDEPEHIVWLGFAEGAIMWFCFFILDSISIWPGIILLYTFSLLDAVDGNIARTANKVTYYGKYLDGVVGEIIEAGYPFFLCLGLYFMTEPHLLFFKLFQSDRHLLIIMGPLIVFGRLFSNIFTNNYYLNLMRHDTKKEAQDIHSAVQISPRKKHWWYLVYINLHYFTVQIFLLALCAALGAVDIFLLIFLAYYLLRMILSLIFFSYKAKKELY